MTSDQSKPKLKGYVVTDGYHECYVVTSSPTKAKSAVHRRIYGIEWIQLRVRRVRQLDSDQEWFCDWGAFTTESYWGAPARAI